MTSKLHLETLVVHAGHAPDAATGAVTPPIHLATTFERAPDGTYPLGHMYARNSNPTRAQFEACMAELDKAAASAAFSSGQAAVTAVFMALGSGVHVIAPLDIYHGTKKILTEVLGPMGVESSFVDMTDLAAVKAAVRANTRLIWIETPSNPLLKIVDIAAVSEIAHAAKAMVACDNTWGTPVLTDPTEFGADIVMHATTKYLGGHSDVLGGVVSVKREGNYLTRLKDIQATTGAVAAPFDCWLVMRGVRTLALRVRQQCDSAGAIAEFLSNHAGVEAVYYPGLPHHPGHDIAKRQMKRYGGMLSFQTRGDEARAFAVAARVRMITRATSLGGVESLIEHRASVEGPDSKTPRNLLRLSVGIEHVDDLIADLDQALKG
ncbi:MAG TPA: PLP-dependent transferase [Caulobacteraceae bacterium]|jgi:cystathionine gamma-synthase|nr:PLP-dependent transferase [Caulobacteraceae bacterium]